jgi:hypothetical protein
MRNSENVPLASVLGIDQYARAVSGRMRRHAEDAILVDVQSKNAHSVFIE